MSPQDLSQLEYVHGIRARSEKNRRGTACRAPTGEQFAVIVTNSVVIVAKQVTHHFDVVVASMVQARQPESRFERLEQRKAVVVPAALNAFVVRVAVGLDGEDDQVLILRREEARSACVLMPL